MASQKEIAIYGRRQAIATQLVSDNPDIRPEQIAAQLNVSYATGRSLLLVSKAKLEMKADALP